MKLINLIKKLGGNRTAIAKSGDMSLQQLNNLVSADREVLKLANGDYILTSKHTKIFKLESKSDQIRTARKSASGKN